MFYPLKSFLIVASTVPTVNKMGDVQPVSFCKMLNSWFSFEGDKTPTKIQPKELQSQAMTVHIPNSTRKPQILLNQAKNDYF